MVLGVVPRHFTRAIPRVITSLLTVLVVAFAGTLAYMLLEGMSLGQAAYQTVVVISTLGIKDSTTGRAGQIVTFVLIIGGIGAVAFAFSSVFSMIVVGELRAVLGRRRVSAKISSLKKHYVVCGYGKMGKLVCRNLRDRGNTVVVVEQDAATTAEAESDGFLYVLGTAHDEQVLQSAGLVRAGGVVSVLPSDADNVFVTLTAHSINSTVPIIARADNVDTVPKLKKAGATSVVSPHAIGASRMACMLTNPAIAEFMDAAAQGDQIEMNELEVPQESPLVGQAIRDTHLREKAGVLVISVKRKDDKQVFNPGPGFVILAGDKLLCVGEQGTMDRLHEALGRTEPDA